MRHLMTLFFLLFTSLYCIQASAMVIVEVNSPPPKEVIIVPKGNLNCIVTPAGIYNGVYVSSHKICRYSNPSKKIIWAAGHWQCSNYRPLRAVCVSWIWIPSRWTATVV
jgi:hypothetical protein